MPAAPGVQTAEQRLLKIDAVCRMTSLCRASIYSMAKARLFPRPVSVGKGRVAWRIEDVNDWIDSRQEVLWAA